MFRPLALAAVAAALSAADARAGLITYNLTGGTFSDGGTFSGTFVLDVTTNSFGGTITDYSISVVGGDTGLYPEFTYTPTNSTFSNAGRVTGIDLYQFKRDGVNIFLTLGFTPNPTDAGGTYDVFVSPGSTGELSLVGGFGFRGATGGQISGAAAVPEPATMGMAALGVASAFGLVRRFGRRPATA